MEPRSAVSAAASSAFRRQLPPPACPRPSEGRMGRQRERGGLSPLSLSLSLSLSSPGSGGGGRRERATNDAARFCLEQCRQGRRRLAGSEVGKWQDGRRAGGWTCFTKRASQATVAAALALGCSRTSQRRHRLREVWPVTCIILPVVCVFSFVSLEWITSQNLKDVASRWDGGGTASKCARSLSSLSLSLSLPLLILTLLPLLFTLPSLSLSPSHSPIGPTVAIADGLTDSCRSIDFNAINSAVASADMGRKEMGTKLVTTGEE